MNIEDLIWQDTESTPDGIDIIYKDIPEAAHLHEFWTRGLSLLREYPDDLIRMHWRVQSRNIIIACTAYGAASYGRHCNLPGTVHVLTKVSTDMVLLSELDGVVLTMVPRREFSFDLERKFEALGLSVEPYSSHSRYWALRSS